MNYFKLLTFIIFLINNIFGSDFTGLQSTDQSVRDECARILKADYVVSKKDKWEKIVSTFKVGDKRSSVIDKFLPLKLDRGPSAGSGHSHSESLRIDSDWVLTLHVDDDDQTVYNWELSQDTQYYWVNPPKNYSGKWITYYANGNKSHEIDYANGKYFGRFISYYSTGEICVIQRYDENGINGDDVGYFKSGKKAYEGKYLNGHQSGIWSWFDESGKIINSREYQ